MNNYWSPIESQWVIEHGDELKALEDLCARTHAFVAGIAQHADFVSRPTSASVVVQRLLLRRLGEELRGVELLAMNGHGFQAISAAANLFEQSHFLTYATISDAVAEKYLAWSDPTKSIASVRAVVEKSGVERGWDKSRIDGEYKRYSFLCGFKHNNAVMQRVLTLPKNPDLVLGQLALLESIWFVLSTMGLLAIRTLGPTATEEAINTCNALMDAVQPLCPTLNIAGATTPPSVPS